MAVGPVDKEAAHSVEPAPRSVIDIRNRNTVPLHATSLIIEPDVRCAGKFTRNRVRENDSNSTVVSDLLGTRAVGAEHNNNEQKCTKRDWL